MLTVHRPGRPGTLAALLTAMAASLFFAAPAKAAFVGDYALERFVLINTGTSDGTAALLNGGLSLALIGGNSGSGEPGSTELFIAASAAGMVQFRYVYSSRDEPGFDSGWYIWGDSVNFLADTDGQSGQVSFPVSAGQIFGWRVDSMDNTFEPGILTISDFAAPTAIPEPGALFLVLTGLGLVAIGRRRVWPDRKSKPRRESGKAPLWVAVLLAAGASTAIAQTQAFYAGTPVTGQLVLTRTVNPVQAAQALRAMGAAVYNPETVPKATKRLRPPALPAKLSIKGGTAMASATAVGTQSFPVVFASGGFGFLGLTHLDQRLANDGNQFSVEPPNQSVAAANGYVLEGVNNAIQVYDSSGAPLLPRVLSSNELFGVPAAINRTTNVHGVYPTDMRVFFDQTISRWFVLQRAQGYDVSGAPLNNSRLYLAVSQTANPVGTYNIYEMDTTNAQNPGCPCIADYPQIGADQYGFYISVNEFTTFSEGFVDAAIFAISKAALGAGVAAPAMHRFLIPYTTGYEFAIEPAKTPPGGAFFTASGGLQYFASTQASNPTFDSGVAVWAMYNTASLNSASPSPVLTRIVTPVLSYRFPGVATQRTGPLPYGSTLFPPGALAFLDGGDNRVQALTYAGGRLYTTFQTQATDDGGLSVVGGAYVVLSPTLRSGVLAAKVLDQRYLVAQGHHVLRPAVAVNAQGRGAVAFTLSGPDHFPSAAYLPVNGTSVGAAIQIAAAGAAPQDGFTGYPGGFGAGVARWGDYSTAVAGNDGMIWMVTQYIPNAPRTEFANWGTFVSRYLP
jgi:hypothetical protein